MSDHNKALDTLEQLIDRYELTGVLNLMAEICSAKADHIRESYNDRLLADCWDTQAARFLYLANGGLNGLKHA